MSTPKQRPQWRVVTASVVAGIPRLHLELLDTPEAAKAEFLQAMQFERPCAVFYDHSIIAAYRVDGIGSFCPEGWGPRT